jgi:hypothetical protein
MKIGRGNPAHASRGAGVNKSRSTPRDQLRIRENPRAASSSRRLAVATMMPCPAP